MSKNNSRKKINLSKDFSYPDPNDPDFLTKIFKKREFFYHKVPERKKLETYEEVQKYRDQNCREGEIIPREQQAIVPNFISPNTPYKGVILMHGTGSGKTGSAILIAEQFKEQVKKYNTKIFVIVPGPNTRDNFKNEILTWTGETYLKNKNILNQMTKAEKDREIKIGLYAASQYYKIMSYKTFYKKVLGEKIVEKKLSDDNKIKSSYKKNLEGDFERELVIDRITNMDNALLIVDEAHNISGNEYGEALKKIIKNSQNLRVVLLTATPMINLADEIIDLLNFLRPENDKIQRDKIFTSEKNYMMKLKPDGLEYLKEKANGYISFYRGNIPYTFAKRIDKGKISDGLLFTPVIKCYMKEFQDSVYLKTKENIDDTLDRTSSAAANFVFPGLNKDKNDIYGYYSTEGITTVLSQLNSDGPKLRSLINQKLFNGKLSKTIEDNFIIETTNKNVTGEILKLKYLQYFSIKFYKIIKRLNKLVENKKGPATAFVYSNLVRAGGMEMFAECLRQNGYLEYQEDGKNYDIKDETIDYKTGKTFAEFKREKLNNFKPATFILITGSPDETGEDIAETKQKIIKDIFNNSDNISGKNIKLCLGSRVMNEGVTLKNCKEVHIIDVFYNIPKVEQVIGRAIRMCVHKDSINDDNKFPKVRVYRYVVAKKNELTTDELLYKKAELKYLLIKEVERGLKEVSLDCPLLLNANMFPEEIEKYKGCVPPTLENIKKGKIICPALCDFKECNYKCNNDKLNIKYFSGNKYKNLAPDELDYNTFNDELAKFEINQIKNKVKDLYRFKHIYLYDEMLKEIKKSFLSHQSDLFDTYFLDQALESMMPRTENDFNNFKDNVFDKYNRAGYLIQRGKYYIFQPFGEFEDVPMYYRENNEISNINQVSLKNYIKQKYGDIKAIGPAVEEKNINKKIIGYDFDSVIDYYEDRDENFIVGIIDKNFNKLASSDIDLFKIRESRGKVTNKKRGTGIPTLKGAVCATSKDKDYLMNLIKKLPNISKDEIKRINNLTREDICNEIRNKLLYLEKYSSSKDNNKMTYVMIPINHRNLPFPFNLEDRIKHHIKQINQICERQVDVKVKKIKGGTFLEETLPDVISYEIIFKNEKFMLQNKDIQNGFNKLGFILKGSEWIKLLD
jgi:hypothetical protein